jgi:hypothetical protein
MVPIKARLMAQLMALAEKGTTWMIAIIPASSCSIK